MKMLKRVLSVVLAVTLLAGLCACKGSSGPGEGNSPGGKKSGTKGGINSELAKQYVYRMQEYDFSGIQLPGDDTYVQGVTESDGRIYIILRNYNNSARSSGAGYRLVCAAMDGSDMQSYELQTSMDEGKSAQKPPAPAPQEESGADEASEEEYPQTYEYTGLSNLQIVGDERVVGTKHYSFEDYSDPENIVSIRENYLCCWDLEGRMLWESSLDLLSSEDHWYYTVALVGMEDGSTIVLIGGDEQGKIVVDDKGAVSDLRPVKGLDQFLEKSNQCTALGDGKVFWTYYGEDWTKMYGATYDFANDTMSEPIQFAPAVVYNMGGYDVAPNGDLIYSNGQGLFRYRLGDEEAVQLMSFVNSDLEVNSFNAILPVDDEHFVGLYSDYDDKTYNSIVKGGFFTKVNPEDIPDKDVLVLGGNYVGGDLRKRVVEYNKSSDTHRIVLREYNQYNNYEDYDAGYRQLNNDIISGNMPDILVVDSYGMSLDNYISKGLLADIGVLIEQDEELSKTEFMENVFEACAVDGRLYEVIPTFYVQTYVAKQSLVGDRDSWTMEDARQVLSSMPEGATLFGSDMVRSEFFNTMMAYCGNDFIDVSTGTCKFDSDEFISLMKFARELPAEMNDDYYEGDWYTAYESQYRENRTLLASCYLSDAQNMVYTINGSFGEDISYVGFPTASGDGAVISVGNSYALAAGSANLDAAWEFIRYYLTDEYQSEIAWQFPVNKKYFEEITLKGTKKPSYTDTDGKEVEYDYTRWINEEEIILEPLTMEQLGQLRDFLSSVKKRRYSNEAVLNIIMEEMDAFFSDQQSAESVANIIQSRAKIYVNENR